MDTEGTRGKFSLAVVKRFHAFQGYRAVYPEDLFLSLVDRILKREMTVVLETNFCARLFGKKQRLGRHLVKQPNGLAFYPRGGGSDGLAASTKRSAGAEQGHGGVTWR